MLKWTPNVPLIEGAVSVGCEWTASDPRLVYGEVVEARSNYKKFSLW